MSKIPLFVSGDIPRQSLQALLNAVKEKDCSFRRVTSRRKAKVVLFYSFRTAQSDVRKVGKDGKVALVLFDEPAESQPRLADHFQFGHHLALAWDLPTDKASGVQLLKDLTGHIP